MDYVYLVIGIVLLLLGGDFLVRGAVSLALKFKVSVLVIGMTVVSFATSAPELLVSLDAALSGHLDISYGNIVGSNISNIALILGLTAIIFPIAVKEVTYKVDWWVLLFVSLLLFGFIYFDKMLVFWEALFLVFLLVVYNLFQIRASRRSKALEEVDVAGQINLTFTILFLIGGVLGLKFGSDFLIRGSVSLAQDWGISERVIGITVVAAGTSLPELSASMVASFKGEQELSLGNLIGSNIFNILAVLGITGLIVDLPVQSEQLLSFDFPWMIGIILLLYPFMRFIGKGQISRWQGFVMLAAYFVYIFLVFS